MNKTNRPPIQIKRIYEPPSPEDGTRILIDRLWPRGVSKERACIDEWMKEIAPSPELHNWFCHKPERFEEFTERYEQELTYEPVHAELSGRIREMADKSGVTLVYAAKDPVYNHAVVLHRWLNGRRSQ